METLQEILLNSTCSKQRWQLVVCTSFTETTLASSVSVFFSSAEGRFGKWKQGKKDQEQRGLFESEQFFTLRNKHTAGTLSIKYTLCIKQGDGVTVAWPSTVRELSALETWSMEPCSANHVQRDSKIEQTFKYPREPWQCNTKFQISTMCFSLFVFYFSANSKRTAVQNSTFQNSRFSNRSLFRRTWATTQMGSVTPLFHPPIINIRSLLHCNLCGARPFSHLVNYMVECKLPSTDRLPSPRDLSMAFEDFNLAQAEESQRKDFVCAVISFNNCWQQWENHNI